MGPSGAEFIPAGVFITCLGIIIVVVVTLIVISCPSVDPQVFPPSLSLSLDLS